MSSAIDVISAPGSRPGIPCLSLMSTVLWSLGPYVSSFSKAVQGLIGLSALREDKRDPVWLWGGVQRSQRTTEKIFETTCSLNCRESQKNVRVCEVRFILKEKRSQLQVDLWLLLEFHILHLQLRNCWLWELIIAQLITRLSLLLVYVVWVQFTNMCACFCERQILTRVQVYKQTHACACACGRQRLTSDGFCYCFPR